MLHRRHRHVQVRDDHAQRIGVARPAARSRLLDRQHPAVNGPGRPVGVLDALGLAVGVAAIAIEAAADLQLRRFMSSRRERGATLETGVWSWCRHPNYLGEIGFWWSLWILGVAARPSFWWSAVGPLAITLLFAFASIPMKDRRMLENHPEWAEHMKRIPALLPLPRRR